MIYNHIVQSNLFVVMLRDLESSWLFLYFTTKARKHKGTPGDWLTKKNKVSN